MEYVKLNNGVKMPILGYGVYQTPPEQTEECVLEQLKSDNWLCWLQKMNSIRSRAEEVVLHDLIYSF